LYADVIGWHWGKDTASGKHNAYFVAGAQNYIGSVHRPNRARSMHRKNEDEIMSTHEGLDAKRRVSADLSARHDASARRTSQRAWAILCTPHTLFIGHLLASRLTHYGWSAEVLTEVPEGFPHDMYIIIAAQVLEYLPSGEKRIIYQMEQSVSSHWFSDAYIHAMKHSRAVLDYSLVNIEYLARQGIAHVFYLPVGADGQYMRPIRPVEKTTEVLFYGDLNPRRRELLEILEKHFDVRVCFEVYGGEMAKAIRAARVVVNLHYYENALLETPRIQECLSLGTFVVSETAQDQDDYPNLQGAVAFFGAGNHQEMVQAIKRALELGANSDMISLAVQRGNARFALAFDRFLVAQGFLVSTSGIAEPVISDL
jgi:hypothetical protein